MGRPAIDRTPLPYTYDGEDAILVALEGSPTGAAVRNVYAPGVDRKVATLLAGGTEGLFLLQDHLGTGAGSATPSGAFNYAPATGAFGTGGGSDFTGREWDGFTGLYYYRARMYDPALGRFTAEDPIGFRGGDINLYGYVHSNPTNKTDPFGLIDPIVYQDPKIYGSSPYRNGAEFADDLDTGINGSRASWKADPRYWIWNGSVDTFCDLALGGSDMFRVGAGTGYAMSAPDENGYGRAAFVAMDIARSAALFATLASPFAGRVGGSPSEPLIPEAIEPRSFNPFTGKTPAEIDARFRQKGFQSSGPDPMGGYGGYTNPRTGRSYHIDPKEYGRYPEPNHVDVNRPRGYKGRLEKRKFPY